MEHPDPITTLRQLWALVLGEDEDAIADDAVFFDLGGDSLTASELIDAAEEKGLIITLEHLFSNPSLQSLASCVLISSSESTASSESRQPASVSSPASDYDPVGQHPEFLSCEDERQNFAQLKPNGCVPPSLGLIDITTKHERDETLRDCDTAILERDSLSLGSIYMLDVNEDGHGQPLSVQGHAQAVAAQCNLPVDRIEDIYPCTPMQESLVAELDGSANQYVRQLVFRLADRVPLDRFRAAWEDTARSNQILRTRLCWSKGSSGFVQAVVVEEVQWQETHADLAGFLHQDEGMVMTPGDPLCRYAIVMGLGDEPQRHFVWTIHHALCDGASIPLILSEVLSRVHSERPPQRQKFRSFIEFSTTTPRKTEQQQYWEKVFSELSPLPYPQVPHGLEFRINPSSTLADSLVLQRNSSLGVTKSLLLRAAWAILLSHYTGTEDVCFGAINSGRMAAPAGLSQVTGPTINLVPIVARIDPEETVRSFLTRIRKQAAEMIPFEHSGMSQIRRYAAGGSRATLVDFQSLLVVHPVGFSDAIAPVTKELGLEYIDDMGKTEQHPYALVLSFTLSANTQIGVQIQYDQRIIPTSQAQGIIHHMRTVLSTLNNATEETLLKSISLLSENDVRQISEWNRFTPLVEEATVDGLFRMQVLKQPSATAVCSQAQSLTYLEVDTYSSSLAFRLVETGMTPGDFVGVCFEKSIWTVVAIVAVLKAGCIYVPIDPGHPKGRIEEVVGTVQIKVVLASPSGAEVLEGLCPRIITVDQSSVPVDEARLPSRSQPSSIAYLLFTSGSSGKPKGILISHSAISTSIKHHGAAFGAGPHWRTLQFCAHTFDISIGEFLTTLSYGGCICVPSEHDRLNDLAGAINSLRANVLLCVPTVANLLHPQDVPGLKTLVLGGEPVTQGIVSRWADKINLTCSYGPSECAVWSSANLGVSPASNPANIGRSIGCAMWIVSPDDYHQLNAIGCVGELAISGPILGQGYFGDKTTTDASFVPAPAWLQKMDPSTPYDRIYLTGDLARYNPDGTFHIVGRRDTQVKLRGFRIELGEIENQLMATGAVTAAVASLPACGPCARQITAVVSSTPSNLEKHSDGRIIISHGGRATVEKLRSHLQFNLAEYMVPSVWVMLERIPLLISGKVDRKSIKGWLESLSPETYATLVESSASNEGSEIVSGSLSDRLRGLWAKVLNTPIEKIGLQTSFFSLGGDSLAAMQVVSEAKALGLPLTVRDIVSANSLGNLVAMTDTFQQGATVDVVESARSQWTFDVLKPYQKMLDERLRDRPSIRVADAYPLAPIQRDILRAREDDPNLFILSWKFTVSSPSSLPVSLKRLAEAWKRVVHNYPILRTIFLTSTGGLPPVQVVLMSVEPDIAISSSSAENAQPNFSNLGIPPVDKCLLPHRALFYQHGEQCYGEIEMNHALLDGWSLGHLRENLLKSYEADADFELHSSPPYKNFIGALRRDRVEADEKYWASILRSQPPSLFRLPVTLPERHAEPVSNKTVIQLPYIKAEALTTFSAQHGVTLASIVYAAWAQTLVVYTRSSDVSFAYIDSGRDENISGVFDIVGPLINILAYHLRDVSVEPAPDGLAGLAQKIQSQRGEDSAHNACSIREVIEKHLKGRRIFNTGVNFQRRPVGMAAGTLRADDLMKESKDPWHVSSAIFPVSHVSRLPQKDSN